MRFLFCRFDESSISPLTLKALSASGIVKMTRVQDATLSECFEGMHPTCLFVNAPLLILSSSLS